MKLGGKPDRKTRSQAEDRQDEADDVEPAGGGRLRLLASVPLKVLGGLLFPLRWLVRRLRRLFGGRNKTEKRSGNPPPDPPRRGQPPPRGGASPIGGAEDEPKWFSPKALVSSKAFWSLILAVLAGSATAAGMFVLARLIASIPTDAKPGFQVEEVSTFIAVAALSMGVLAGCGPLGKHLREGLADTYRKRKEREKMWQDILTPLLAPGDMIPTWMRTDREKCKTGTELYVSTFKIENSPLEAYLNFTEQLPSYMPDTAGVVIEGAEPGVGPLRMVPSGACQYLLIYHTSADQLGKEANSPHLKSWENPEDEKITVEASPEGLFAVRYMLKTALGKSSIPQMAVLSASQHHAPGVSSFTEGEPVMWELDCKYRKNTITPHELRNKLEKLRESLGCEWLRVAPDSEAGEVRLWISNCQPDEAILKDEPHRTEDDRLRVPGGSETAGASATRLKLIESEWWYLLAGAVKQMPSSFELLEQRCWLNQNRNQMLSEATFKSVFENTDDIVKYLTDELNASWLYVETDHESRQTRVSWAMNVPTDAYLLPAQDTQIRKEAAKNAFLKHWKPFDTKNTGNIDIDDVLFHTYQTSEGETGELIEIVCNSGKSQPLGKYKNSSITLSMTNLDVKWLRIGQPFGREEKGKHFSIVCAREPDIDISPTEDLGKWIYGLNIVWAYALQKSECFSMQMTECVDISQANVLLQTRWLLPTGFTFSLFAEMTSKVDSTVAHEVMVPGSLKEDKEGVYLVSGVKMLASEDEWASKEKGELVGKWDWERMMLLCQIRTHDNRVPKLLETKVVGRTSTHTVELPAGMGEETMHSNEKKIKSTGNFYYLEIRPRSGNVMEATVSYDDPLENAVSMPKLNPRPANWDTIPLGVGIHRQTGTTPGYSPFTIYWDLRRDPHMLMAGRTGSGKTSAMRVIAAEAASRGFRLRVIDAVKLGADFSGIYEYKELCEMAEFELETAHDLIKETHEEVTRRVGENKKFKVGNWYDRPKEHRPRPILLMIDEVFSMLEQAVGNDDETKKQNALKSGVLTYISKIAREARSAGIHMLLAAQRPDAKVVVGELKTNLGARLLLGQAHPTELEMMIPDSSLAPKLTGSAPKGRALFYQGGLESRLVQTYWAGESEEVHENLRRMYSKLRGKEVEFSSVR